MSIAIRIEPHDLLFCRDGRPIVAGAGSAAGSALPNPQVIAGCIRTALLRQRGELPGDGSRPEQAAIDRVQKVSIRGPLPYCLSANAPLIPCPADVASQGKAKHGIPENRPFVRLRPLDEDLASRLHWQAEADAPATRPLWSAARQDGRTASADTSDAHGAWFGQSGWLTWDGFLAWQRGEVPPSDQHCPDDTLWTRESRTQVALDAASAIASEGMLFTTHYLRLQKNIALYAELDGADDLLPAVGDSCTALLGGDRRKVTMTRIPAADWPACPRSDAVACALSPTILPSGLRCPPEWSPCCTGLAVAGHLSVSGWDLAANGGKGAPRPTRNACLPGAVWHLSTLTEKPKAIGNEPASGFGWLAWGQAPA